MSWNFYSSFSPNFPAIGRGLKKLWEAWGTMLRENLCVAQGVGHVLFLNYTNLQLVSIKKLFRTVLWDETCTSGIWGAGGFAGMWYHLNSWVIQSRLAVVLLSHHSQGQWCSGNVFSQTDRSKTSRQEQLPPRSTHFSQHLFLWDDGLMLSLRPQRYLFSLLAIWEPSQEMLSLLMFLNLSIWRLGADIF